MVLCLRIVFPVDCANCSIRDMSKMLGVIPRTGPFRERSSAKIRCESLVVDRSRRKWTFADGRCYEWVRSLYHCTRKLRRCILLIKYEQNEPVLGSRRLLVSETRHDRNATLHWRLTR